MCRERGCRNTDTNYDKQTMIAAKRIAADMVAELYAADKQRRKMRLERDKRTRITVGARMSREDAEYYRKAAATTHRSLHQFTKDALMAELERCGMDVPW